MAPLIWVGLGIVGGFGLCAVLTVGAMGYWICHAEAGVDPFADLPTFDDAEAEALLDAGA